MMTNRVTLALTSLRAGTALILIVHGIARARLGIVDDAVELIAGIYLVHASAGWFVVGAGRNGMEFSVLLILCLTVIAMSAPASASSDPYRYD
jgi:uncharacterized membrane protein YphA (DoxX/SURF4 family)